MAKKNYYAVKAGRRTGIFTTWDGADGAKAQVNGFAGALYKGFATKEEAQAYLSADDADAKTDNVPERKGIQPERRSEAELAQKARQGEADSRPQVSVHSAMSRESALAALRKVVIAGDVHPQIALLENVFEKTARSPIPEEVLSEQEAYRRLCDRYGMELNDGLLFESHPDMDAIAFVDGGGDKSGEKQASSSIPSA